MSSSLPECPMDCEVDFGRKLISYLNDSFIKDNWCWKDFIKYFPHLKEQAEKYFEEVETGNPGLFACWMVRYGDSKIEWAEKIIEKQIDKEFGDPALAAKNMVFHCGSQREWEKRIKQKWDKILEKRERRNSPGNIVS